METKRTLIFILGGGRGFGRSCAISAANMYVNDSLLVLFGRNLESLTKTKDDVKEINKTIQVKIFQLDLESVVFDEIKCILENILTNDSKPFEGFLIIHNAGSVGDPSKLSYEHYDRDIIESLTKVNLTGTVIVNNAILDWIDRKHNKESLVLVVNVSSLAAVKPLTSLSLYCSVKASREMFFRCLSEDWSRYKTLNIFVINYSPGPMDTDMNSFVLSLAPPSESINYLRKLKETKTILDPQMSSDKLFFTILKNYCNYESGSRLDYYDV